MLFKNEKADDRMFMNLTKRYSEINAKGKRCKIKRKVEKLCWWDLMLETF